MDLKEAEKIYQLVRNDEYPPTNRILLSNAQLSLAKAGKTKPVACIAQWVFQLEGGIVSMDDWHKVCEIE